MTFIFTETVHVNQHFGKMSVLASRLIFDRSPLLHSLMFKVRIGGGEADPRSLPRGNFEAQTTGTANTCLVNHVVFKCNNCCNHLATYGIFITFRLACSS